MNQEFNNLLHSMIFNVQKFNFIGLNKGLKILSKIGELR